VSWMGLMNFQPVAGSSRASCVGPVLCCIIPGFFCLQVHRTVMLHIRNPQRVSLS
jgi:hypothetical protein